jgi:hypothetical protein
MIVPIQIVADAVGLFGGGSFLLRPREEGLHVSVVGGGPRRLDGFVEVSPLKESFCAGRYHEKQCRNG